MSTPQGPGQPAGWYPDGTGSVRWWDGSAWTEHTQPAAQPPAAPSYAPAAQQFGQQPFGQQPRSRGKGWLWAVLAAVLVLAVVGGSIAAYFLLGDDDSGGGGGGNDASAGSPEDAVESYYDAFIDGDFATACGLLSEDSQESAFEEYDSDSCDDWADDWEASDEYADYEEFVQDVEISYEIGEVKEDGDTATVDVTTTFDYTGDDPTFEDIYGEPTTETLDLVKEDGEWRVAEDMDEEVSEEPAG
jgi:hypothetical protein